MTQSTRVSYIDTLRGFSLFWILLSNLLVFQGIYFAEDSERWLDQQTYNAVILFVVDSGLPIFTLLFGYSVVKLYEAAHRRGKASRWLFIRRALGLYALGVAHSYLFESDILRTYGLLLLYLLLFVRLPAKWLFACTVICYGLSCSLFFMEGWLQALGMYIPYSAITDVLFTLILTPIPILPMMLLGMTLAKYGVFVDLQQERRWHLLGSVLIPIGLFVKYKANEQPLLYIIDNGELLALGYVFFWAWVCSYVGKHLIFTDVGTLSLTNYLVQSIVCTFIFHYLQLGNQLGAFYGVLFGIALYCCQCIGSVYYLKHFQRGPFEQLLRMLTNWSWNGELR